MVIQINLSNKLAFTLITFLLIILIGGFIFAYTSDGSGNPSIMGHSIDEISGTIGGQLIFTKCQLKLSLTPIYPTCPSGYKSIHNYSSYSVTGWYGDFAGYGRGIDVSPQYTCQIPPCIKQGSIGSDDYWVYHNYNGQSAGIMACSVCEKQ